MKRNILFLLLIVVYQQLGSQNLVPNPSFEEHKTCEFIGGAIDTNFVNPTVVNSWCSGSFSGTPDYFNNCQVFNDYYHLGVPVNKNGYQFPVSGDAYAGICNRSNYTSSIDFREYLQTKLIKKLTKGVSYCVGFYTSLAECDSARISDEWSIGATKNWGLLLSGNRPFNPTEVSSTSPPTAFTLSGMAQIEVTDFITDTTNWRLVSGVYTATGNEEWLTIGNFNPPGGTPVDTVYYGIAPNIVSYYFIDNVFVIPMNNGGLLPGDTSVCASDFPLELSAFDGFTNYLWSNGANTQVTAVDQPGLYGIQANYEGCQITDTIQVEVLPVPELHLTDIHLCEEALPQPYSVPDGAGFTSYLWSDGSTGKDIMVTSRDDLIVQAFSECGTATDTLQVEIDTVPVVDLGPDQSLCEQGTNIVLALKNNGGILPDYLWSTGQTTAQIQVNTAGVYTLSTENGCGTYTDEIVLTGCPPVIYVPNVFDLSAENQENAVFKAFVSNAEVTGMDIYDRWGGLVYRQSSGAAAWDGTWRGKKVEEGVYTYLIRYKDLNTGGIKSVSGTVLLLGGE